MCNNSSIHCGFDRKRQRGHQCASDGTHSAHQIPLERPSRTEQRRTPEHEAAGEQQDPDHHFFHLFFRFSLYSTPSENPH